MRGGGARSARTRIGLLVAVVVVAAAAGAATLLIQRHDSPSRAARGVAASVASPRPSPTPTPTPSPSPKTPWPIPGYLLIADRGNNRLLLVDSRKHVIWRYPVPGRRPTFPFSADDDAFFAPDFRSIISQQEFQQTMQVLSFPGGRVTWHYGHPNAPGSAPGYLNTPDDAYLLPSGVRQVADIRNCRILFVAPSHRIVRQLGTTGDCTHDPPRSFASPNGDTPMPNGATLVSEIGGSWIDAISRSGRLLWSVHAPVAYPSDAQWLGHGRILLADFSSPGHVLIMTRLGRVLWRYGPAAGRGRLDHPSLALELTPNLIAVNDDFDARVVVIDRRTHRIVWQYGHTDVPGSARGYLNIPDGVDLLPFSVAMSIPSIRSLVEGR